VPGWYWIGVCVGLGVGLGVLFAGVLPPGRAGLVAALALGAAAGFGVGLAIADLGGAVGGAVGGVAGAPGAAQVVRGTLRRGGTRGGTGLLIGLGALVVAALALVPVVGYLEAVAVPALGFRLKNRAPERYAGLRSLARD
jgi:hypothetical protein